MASPKVSPVKADVAVATTTPRVTPTPPRAGKFSEVLSRTAVRGAEVAMRNLPGAPLMAVALRGGAGAVPSVGVPLSGPSVMKTGSPEGPVAPGQMSTSPITAAGGTGTLPGGEQASIEGSLAQAQEMNLYYLQIQEAVNAQNRSFTTLSNVLKAEHDTVKTAIGNIR
jgi:hypothetical protein